ncbi:PcfJ domain-containing protein [Paenibacillus sp. FSL K6-0276]|uniref:PcfJ domain-containing protein n=1 Tax=Paenibacillus sp. FSL K6-0276 TaxID=2921450 RepID=UPI0030EC7BFA
MKEQEFHEHFPKEISTELRTYITNECMDWSRYIFTHREGTRQWAFCTHCKQEHPTDTTLKHGQIAQCPHCGAVGHTKASGRGRKTLVDHAYLLWYEKSLIDPNILIARGIYSTRDYTKDYRKTETEVKTIALYLFQWGKGGKMMHRSYWTDRGKWLTQKKVSSEVKRAMNYVSSYNSFENMKSAVKGTPFQYCTWEQYNFNDRVEVFDLAARYKCIEFLTKFGLNHFVTTKLEDGPTFGAINWNGATPEKVLRLTKSEMKAMKNSKVSIGLRTLKSYQMSKKEGSNLDWKEAQILSDFIEVRYANPLNGLLSETLNNRFSVVEMKRYFLKQIRNNLMHYRVGRDVLNEYLDYVRDCEQLGMNLGRDSVLMPNNLHEAHQETMKRIKITTDIQINDLIAERVSELKRFRFQHKELFIIPATTSEDLIKEGKELSHCVGGYLTKYAHGKCDIFFVRKKDKPSEPYYTMEVVEGEVRQCRGFENKAMTTEVKEFVDLFKAKRLSKKIKVSTKKSKELQGVAV